MSTTANGPDIGAPDTHGGHNVSKLKVGAVGLVSVLFMALSGAAPITAMTGNVPIAIGYGNGIHAPGGYLFAMIVLVFFTLGYTAMTRHITATGAFYGFVSHGLGQIAGMGAGLMATLAYVVFEGSLVGIFASFAKTTVVLFGGPDISYIFYALLCIAIVAVLGYFDIEVSGKLLAVFVTSEVVILLLMSLGVLAHGGGPNGMQFSDLNPIKGFSAVPNDPKAGIVGSAAIGLFFAFWSWVGFETTAVYAEESREPRRIIPKATLIAVIGLGIFYTFISWMAIVGNGTHQAIAISRGSTGNSFDVFYGVTAHYVGSWAKDIYEILVVTSSFACALAFHNTASRYLYAIGREGLTDGLHRTLGSTHHKHKSPHIASLTQSVITLAITLGFFLFQSSSKAAPDVAYFFQYGLLAIMGTMALLIVMALASISVIWYFHVQNRHPETRSWWRTFLSPGIGALGMFYVVYLLFTNLSFAAGAATTSPVYKITPYLVIGSGLLGVVLAAIIKQVSPDKYQRIGRIVMAEAVERTD
ncbi:MAG: APC family permease [Actinomycetota bacterium]|nr:APC family permease [Actinomycetota bacterium]